MKISSSTKSFGEMLMGFNLSVHPSNFHCFTETWLFINILLLYEMKDLTTILLVAIVVVKA